MNLSLRLMQRFHLKQPFELSRSSLSCSKTSIFLTSRVLATEELSFLTKKILGSLIKSISTLDSAYSSVKHLPSTECRRYCTGIASKKPSKKSRAIYEIRVALIDYLHVTRGLDFTDAEHMSKNSPYFLAKLLKKIDNEEDIGSTMSRFFRYHPINEFEPFFESSGLKPTEFSSLLPRDLMFLSDDEGLLENYHVLCNYGIAREKIGKIYREATEVFRLQFGVLGLKLRTYEQLGLSKTTVIKVIASCPTLLIGDVDKDFLKILEKLESLGFNRDWVGGVLLEKNAYNWGHMLVFLQFLRELGFTDEQIGSLIRRQPGFIMDGSGKTSFLLVGLLLKFGATKKYLFTLFLQFPNVQIGIFMRNLWRGLMFLIDIEMDDADIQKFVLAHTEMLGTYCLMKPKTILTYLSTGRGRLCRIIREDPNQLKKYALGVKVNPLPHCVNKERSLVEKKKFLMRLGFSEDSEEMKKALTVFRGKGDELQDRCDFFVKLGLDQDDVCNMIRAAPHILNQKMDVLESKISFLVNDLGYPLTSLVPFPQYLAFTIERVNLRMSMYNWLRDKGKVIPTLSLSSILSCSEKRFVKRFVDFDPEGPKIWENLKNSSSTS